MSLFGSSNWAFVLGLFISLTYNKKEAPAFGSAMTFWCILLSFLGFLFCHLSFNLSNYNVLTAHSPFCYQISGTWSNHEGSIFLWCWILSLYGFIMGSSKEYVSYGPTLGSCSVGIGRGRAFAFQRRRLGVHLQKRLLSSPSYDSNFVSYPNSRDSLSIRRDSGRTRPYQKGSALCKLPFDSPLDRLPLSSRSPFVLYRHPFSSDSAQIGPEPAHQRARHLGPQANRQIGGEQERRKDLLALSPKMSMDIVRKRGAFSRIPDCAFTISLFFSTFLLASSDPFVRNLFLCTEPLAELNPVLQDPILAIHPPLLYAGQIASSCGFALCFSRIKKRIQALHSPPHLYIGPGERPPIRKIRSFFFVDSFFLDSPRTPSGSRGQVRSLWLGNRGRPHKGRLRWAPYGDPDPSKKTHNSVFQHIHPGCANTCVSDVYLSPIRIWILTSWSFLTMGILLGSWWAYHELGWGGWWFWDPVENASFLPWLLATACIHSVIFPLLNSWTLFLNIVTFLSCVLATFSIRAGLLTSVHSFATDDARGLFLWWFFLSLTFISLSAFVHMKKQALALRIHPNPTIVARRTALSTH